MVYAYRPENQHVPAFCRTHAPYVFTPTAEQQAFNAAVRVGALGRAGGAVRDRVRDAVAASADTLDLLDRMARYKQLHETLHALDYSVFPQLEAAVGRLHADPPRFRATPNEVRQLRKYCGDLDEHVETAARTAARLPPAEREAEAVWVDQLRTAAAPIRKALDADGDPADRFPTCAALIAALENPPPPPPKAVPKPPAAAAPARGALRGWVESAAAAAVVFAVVWYFTRPSGAPATQPAPAPIPVAAATPAPTPVA